MQTDQQTRLDAAYRQSVEHLNAWRQDAKPEPAPAVATFRRDVDILADLATRSTKGNHRADETEAYERSVRSLNSWRDQ